jgi:hypothetical protein
MKKSIFTLIVLTIFSASFVSAEEYDTAHRPGLIEAVGGLVRTAVELPFAIVGGVATGLTTGIAGGDTEILINPNNLPVTYNAVTGEPLYYNQFMTGPPPINPGYGYTGWYWLPTGVVFVSNNNEHRHHVYNHGGMYQGRQFQQRPQNNGYQQGAQPNHNLQQNFNRQNHNSNTKTNQGHRQRYDGGNRSNRQHDPNRR